MMNRRTFLKIMLGTAPGIAVTGLQAAVWSEDQMTRPENDPVTICIEKSGYLSDPAYDGPPVTRRFFHGIDDMTRHQRYDFYRDRLGEQALRQFLLKDEEEFDDVRISFSRLDEIDKSLEAYLAGEPDPGEGSFRDILEKSRYWIGGWLYDNLPADAVRKLDLTYVEGDESENLFCAVRYTGSLEQINAVLAACGMNAVCFRES
jgi:hypothetical protein